MLKNTISEGFYQMWCKHWEIMLISAWRKIIKWKKLCISKYCDTILITTWCEPSKHLNLTLCLEKRANLLELSWSGLSESKCISSPLNKPSRRKRNQKLRLSLITWGTDTSPCGDCISKKSKARGALRVRRERDITLSSKRGYLTPWGKQ